MGELGTINPTTALDVVSTKGTERTVQINAYQMKGAEQVLYMGEGQRAVVATLTEQGQKALQAQDYKTDAYGNQWRAVNLTATITSPVVDSLSKFGLMPNSLITFTVRPAMRKFQPVTLP